MIAAGSGSSRTISETTLVSITITTGRPHEVIRPGGICSCATPWGTVTLIDILEETVLRTGCLAEVSAVADSGTSPVEVLAEPLMLPIYTYGTNARIRCRRAQSRCPPTFVAGCTWTSLVRNWS